MYVWAWSLVGNSRLPLLNHSLFPFSSTKDGSDTPPVLPLKYGFVIFHWISILGDKFGKLMSLTSWEIFHKINITLPWWKRAVNICKSSCQNFSFFIIADLYDLYHFHLFWEAGPFILARIHFCSLNRHFPLLPLASYRTGIKRVILYFQTYAKFDHLYL